MNRTTDFLQALVAVLVIAITQAACTDANDYAAPTKAEIDVQQQIQRSLS